MLVFVAALYYLIDVLVILFMALIISSALDAPISFLERRGFPRILGTFTIFLAVVAAVALLLYTIIPIAFVEFKTFVGGFGKIDLPGLETIGAPQFVKGLEKNLSHFSGFADALLSGSASFIDVVSTIFGGVVFIVAVLVLSFYLSLNRDGVEKFLKAVLPLAHEEYVIKIYHRVRRKLGLWLQGQIILSSIVGIVVFLGLWILGINYSLVLGIMAGVLETVPFVGPVFTGSVAFLIAMSESLTLGLSVVALFIIIQQLENHLLIPLVMGRTIGLHPVVIAISLLAGAQLAGFIGIILAVPTAVIIQEIIEDREARKHRYEAH